MSTLLEYENQNSRRNYPFSDDATMLDTSGTPIPQDFIIDAHLYPLLPAGVGLYLSEIVTGTRTLIFSRSDNGTAYAYATLDENARTAAVLEYAGYERQVGVVVIGPGQSNVYNGYPSRKFSASGAPLCPAAFIDLDQYGVRGYLLPDGTLVTGDVQFIGEGGVVITSYGPEQGNRLRFDIVGAPDPQDLKCGEDTRICAIDARRLPGSRFLISAGINTLNLSVLGATLDDTCAAKKDEYLPNADGELPANPPDGVDMCEYVPEPVVPPVDPGVQVVSLPICADGTGTFLNISAPSGIGAPNALHVVPLPASDTTIALKLPRVIPDTATLTRAVEQHDLKQFGNNGIMIELRGT